MAQQPRRYRRKPLATFEHGTRIYAPTPSEDCYRVSATDATGRRVSHKFAVESHAREKARELEAFLATRTPLYGGRSGDRTVGVLASLYIDHLEGRSVRYRERQDGLLRCWILPKLADVNVSDWTPALSEEVLRSARAKLAAQSVHPWWCARAVSAHHRMSLGAVPRGRQSQNRIGLSARRPWGGWHQKVT